jgi:eukaryotic-like serine/threonine-protein kinase
LHPHDAVFLKQMPKPAADTGTEVVAERVTLSLARAEDRHPRTMPPESRAGEVIAGKYLVEEVIGSGGMGVVVSALHLELGERVALKFLTKGTDGSAVARFRREARIAVRMRSEHVARLMDVGTLEGGAPFLVMELLYGRTLRERLESSGLVPLEEAIDLVLQACEGVAEAHALGIIHRDLKPSNLLVTSRPDGSPLVKILDFGIAKLLATSATAAAETTSTDTISEVRSVALPPDQTATSSVLGSPYYMSPEQVRNSAGVDARCDIWALGVILCEILTGELPFTGRTTADILRAIERDPPKLDAILGPANKSIGPVIAKCLEKDPDRRWRDVGELAMALLPHAAERSRLSAERTVRVLEQRPLDSGERSRHGARSLSSETTTPSRTGWRVVWIIASLAACGAIARPLLWWRASSASNVARNDDIATGSAIDTGSAATIVPEAPMSAPASASPAVSVETPSAARSAPPPLRDRSPIGQQQPVARASAPEPSVPVTSPPAATSASPRPSSAFDIESATSTRH